jgi:hypothetical protein
VYKRAAAAAVQGIGNRSLHTGKHKQLLLLLLLLQDDAAQITQGLHPSSRQEMWRSLTTNHHNSCKSICGSAHYSTVTFSRDLLHQYTPVQCVYLPLQSAACCCPCAADLGLAVFNTPQQR